MFLHLKNIGKIYTADIEINAITVIGGLNNTGKSTIGKTLFCVFNSMYKIKEQIEIERRSAIQSALSELFEDEYGFSQLSIFDSNESELVEKADYIITNRTKYTDGELSLLLELTDFVAEHDLDEEEYIDTIETVTDVIMQNLSISDNAILVTLLRKKIQEEFSMQINNMYQADQTSEITLGIKNSKVQIQVKDNKDIQISDSINLNTEVIYLDDPFALDSLRMPYFSYHTNPASHREHLTMLLHWRAEGSAVRGVMDEIVASTKLEAVLAKLGTVVHGEMRQMRGGPVTYKESGMDTPLDLGNLSAGLKTFALIKTLLLNGSLEEKGTLVLDEPEIHLHPEWQLIFAELIVLLQKEFQMHILVNTHSPYFLEAIEVFSAKHGIADQCRYYLADDKGQSSIFVDVTDNLEPLYSKLAFPLQKLEDTRYAEDVDD